MISRDEILGRISDDFWASTEGRAVMADAASSMQLLPIFEAASALRISVRKLKTLVPVYDLGRPRVKVSDIEKLLESRKVPKRN
jgi:hypothetical protein